MDLDHKSPQDLKEKRLEELSKHGYYNITGLFVDKFLIGKNLIRYVNTLTNNDKWIFFQKERS